MNERQRQLSRCPHGSLEERACDLCHSGLPLSAKDWPSTCRHGRCNGACETCRWECRHGHSGFGCGLCMESAKARYYAMDAENVERLARCVDLGMAAIANDLLLYPYTEHLRLQSMYDAGTEEA